jgi:hypothetical protein
MESTRDVIKIRKGWRLYWSGYYVHGCNRHRSPCDILDFLWIDGAQRSSLEAVQGHLIAAKGSQAVPLVRSAPTTLF